jgi:hypothetical protein
MGKAGVGRSERRVPPAGRDFDDDCGPMAAAEGAAQVILRPMLYSLHL